MSEDKILQSVRKIVVYRSPANSDDCTRVIDTFASGGVSVTEVIVNAEHPVVIALQASGEKVGTPIVYVDDKFAFSGPNIYRATIIKQQEQSLLVEAGRVSA